MTNSFLNHPVAQVIPHSSPRSVRLPVIDDPKTLQDKFDLCNVLSDIEAAQVMADAAAMAQQQVWGLWEQNVWSLWEQ